MELLFYMYIQTGDNRNTINDKAHLNTNNSALASTDTLTNAHANVKTNGTKQKDRQSKYT